MISAQEDYINTLRNINAGYAEEEIAMSSMTNMIRRMQDIAIAGANQTYSQSELDLFANEVQGYIDDIRGLANTKDSNGHYIFLEQKQRQNLSLSRRMVLLYIKEINQK